MVSIGDKNLPTNPTAKDRRALQTTVAHKITARIVKTANGVRAARRRGSDFSSDGSNYGTPNSKLTYHYAGETISSVGAAALRHSSTPYMAGARKRANQTTINNLSNNNAKRSKGGKKGATVAAITAASVNGSTINTAISTATSNANNGSRTVNIKRQNSDNDEAETIDKRNLHNDMERQRRIGLKNLFENLKEKIPTLREKDRAPKVNILREATLLCCKLTRDEAEYEALKRRQQRLINRLKQIRASVAALRGNANVV